MTVNSAKNSGKRQMPKGKPFEKGDPRINRAGAPKRGQTWQETIKRITDMTREEAIEYVGANTKIGKQLKELSPQMPIKDAIVFATIIAYGREPNARMFAALMDREDGKPIQSVELSGKDGNPVEIGVKLIDYRTGITTTESGPSEDHHPSSQDEDSGDGETLG
jgi:hypothetical protein